MFMRLYTRCFNSLLRHKDNALLFSIDETVASEYAVLMVQTEWRSFMLRRRKIIETFLGSTGKRLKVTKPVAFPLPQKNLY